MRAACLWVPARGAGERRELRPSARGAGREPARSAMGAPGPALPLPLPLPALLLLLLLAPSARPRE